MADRLAYLEALGLTAWVRRGAAPATRGAAGPSPLPSDTAEAAEPVALTEAEARPSGAPRVSIALEPGQGSCLYLCGAGDDSASALASDLARVAPESPVWARLREDDQGQLLEAVIAERLITQVVVFGEAVARLVFGGQAPESAGPARVTVVDDLERLARDPGARRACWAAFRAAGLPASR